MMMTPSNPLIHIHLREWEYLSPEQAPELRGLGLGESSQIRQLIQELAAADRLHITELRDGLTIRSTSFVGRLRLGHLQINIRPKLPFNVLLTLFRYAYHLHDLTIIHTKSRFETEPDAFQDFLIEQLASEANELITRGLYRQYQRIDEDLATPKGRIDLQAIARRGGILEARLPVIHHSRIEDSLINQVLLAGLGLGARLTSNLRLRSRLRRIAKLIEVELSPIELSLATLRQARRESNRLTSHYDAVLTLIELLFQSMGVSLEAKQEAISLPSFLFDMNLFFERLVGRFLKDYLHGYTVNEQQRLAEMIRYVPDYNPQKRKAPTPRPDFVITQGQKTLGILDAKYRDLWHQHLPAAMLYQLGIYALSRGQNRKASIIYPSVGAEASPQVIEIRDPLSASNLATVSLRNLDLLQLSQLLPRKDYRAQEELEALAHYLAFGK